MNDEIFIYEYCNLINTKNNFLIYHNVLEDYMQVENTKNVLFFIFTILLGKNEQKKQKIIEK